MAQIKVNYLMLDKIYYSNGQSIVEKEAAMMPDSRIQYYLNTAEARGLDFGVQTETIDVSDEDAEDYISAGYCLI